MFLNKKIIIFILFVVQFQQGCRTILTGLSQISEIDDSVVQKSAEDLTPRQEHYLGRSIIARVLNENKPLPDNGIQDYMNRLGQYLALHSTRAETYAGYRFVVTQSKTPSALSAPGGFVAVSSALLNLANNEDELAAILAHEIAHVELRHAERNIKAKNRIVLGKQIVNAFAVAIPSAPHLAYFTDAVSIGLEGKFNQNQEYEADESALRILQSAGYSPVSLYKVISRIPDSSSFFG
ncbi:MAG: hypothetical protein EBR09_12075, partial [Proteobacteria bacterium]|nr:hypothetical protein [Pseudomonadota bacterium]